MRWGREDDQAPLEATLGPSLDFPSLRPLLACSDQNRASLMFRSPTLLRGGVVILALLPSLAALGLPWNALELAYQEACLRSWAAAREGAFWLQLQRIDVPAESFGLWAHRSYRPLVHLGLLSEWQLGQGAVWPSRLSSLALSASSCALLVSALGRRLPRHRQWPQLLLILWWWHPAWVALHLSVFGRASLHVTLGASWLMWSLSTGPSAHGWRHASKDLGQLVACALLASSHELGALVALAFGLWRLRRCERRFRALGVSGLIVVAALFALGRHFPPDVSLLLREPFWSHLAAAWWRLHGTAVVPWRVPEICSLSTTRDSLQALFGALLGAGELSFLFKVRKTALGRAGLWLFVLGLTAVGTALLLGETTGRWTVFWPLAGWLLALRLGRVPFAVLARSEPAASLLGRFSSAFRVRPSLRHALGLLLLVALLTLAARRTALGFVPARYWAEQLKLCPRDLALALPLAEAEHRSGERLTALVRLRCAYQTAVRWQDQRVAGQSLLLLVEQLRRMTPARSTVIVREHARFLRGALDGRSGELSYGSFRVSFSADPVERRAVELFRAEFLLLFAEALADVMDPAAVDAALQAAAACSDCPDLAKRSSRVCLRFARFTEAERIIQRAGLLDSSYFGTRSYRAFSDEVRALHDAARASGNQYLLLNYDLLVGNVERAFQRIVAFPQLVESIRASRALSLAEFAYAAGYTEWTGRLIARHLSGEEQVEFLGQMLFETNLAFPPVANELPRFEGGQCARLVVPASEASP